MLLRNNPYFAILCLTALMSGCVAFTAWIRRECAPATRPFTWLMVAIAAYATTAAIGALPRTPQSVIFWVTLETLCSSIVTALFFTFTLHFTHRHQWLTRWRRALIWAVPAFNMGLILTNPWHHKIWQSFTVSPGTYPGSYVVTFHHGPAYLWMAGCFYMYVLTGTLMVCRAALRPSMLYRQQAITVIVSALPPLIIGTLYVLELVPPGLSLLPMSFLFTGLIYFTSLFRFRLFDLRPIARDTLIERMIDSVLVLDNEGRILDMNPAAHRFTQSAPVPLPPAAERNAALSLSQGQSPHDLSPTPHPPTPQQMSVDKAIGQPITTLLAPWPTLVHHCQQNIHNPQNNEVLVTLTQRPLHLNLRFSVLHDSHHHLTGQLVVIQDVTAQHQAQCELKQNNEILEQRLLKIEALQAQLKEQAIRDGLTKLFNRRYFEEALLAEFSKARRYRTSLAVILIDIDHFKRVNDTYGHQAGDCALQVLAELIREHVRTSDIACRYGGEEFIVAMPGMTLVEALQRAEALRIAFKETAIQYKGQTIQATISGGVGALPEYGGSQDGLISVVDKALYKAKENGRDRIYPIQLDNLPNSPPNDTPNSTPLTPNLIPTSQ